MSDMKRFIFEGACYHTISVTRRRRPVFFVAETESLLGAINFARQSGKAWVLAFAILSDHMHLLLVARDGATVSDVMKSIKNYVSTSINRRMGGRGALWQQGFYDRVIRNDTQLRTVIEYIRWNPIAAGLASDSYSYRYVSSNPELSTDLDAFLVG